MLKLLLIILFIKILFIKCMHQIDCETYLENNAYYGDNYYSTGCHDYVLEYLEAYLGILQNSNVPSNLPDQGYNQKQIPIPPSALYYDPPTTFHGNSYINDYLGLNVYINVELVDMVGIDTANGLVYLNINLDIFWFDYRLAWNTTLAPVYQVYIDSSYLWLPDITLYNQADGSSVLDAPAILFASGDLWLSRQAYLIYNCNLDLHKFPFDVQVCPMKFASWLYISPQLNLYVRTIQFSSDKSINRLISNNFRHSISWNTVSFIPSNGTEPSIYGNYSVAYYTITCQRYSNYYVYTAIMPDIFATVITIVALWVPDINSRMAISVTSLLTVIAVMWTITANLPVTESSTWMQEFSTFCIVIIGLCCFENAMAAYAQTKQGKPPKWMRYFIDATNIFSIIYQRTFLFFVDNCCDVCCIVYGKFFTVPLKRRTRRKVNNFGLQSGQVEGGQSKNPMQTADIEMHDIDDQNIKQLARDKGEVDSDDEQNTDNDDVNTVNQHHNKQHQDHHHHHHQQEQEQESKDNDINNKIGNDNDDEDASLLNNNTDEELSWARIGRGVDRISRVAIPIAFASGSIRLIKIAYD